MRRQNTRRLGAVQFGSRARGGEGGTSACLAGVEGGGALGTFHDDVAQFRRGHYLGVLAVAEHPAGNLVQTANINLDEQRAVRDGLDALRTMQTALLDPIGDLGN